MASDRDYHLGRIRAAKANPGLSEDIRGMIVAFHEKQLERFPTASGRKKAAAPTPSSEPASPPTRKGSFTQGASTTPKPPRAAEKAAPATPPGDAQHAAPTPAPSAAAAYTAAHAHLHQPGAAPAAKPAPAEQPTSLWPAHSTDQLSALAGYHEQQQRNLAARGDLRGAAVHGQKAAGMRKMLEQRGAASGGGENEPVHNAEASLHMEKASESRMLANRAGIARAAAAADVMTAKRKAEEIAADPNRGKNSVEHGMAMAEVASHREKVAHHANIEKGHFADEKLHIARAKAARASNPEESARAEHEAQAAHARADQAREAVRGGEQRIAIAQIHAKTAQERAEGQGPEDEHGGGHGGRDPLHERAERIRRASHEFLSLLHTGSHDLIKHMHNQVGH